MKSYKYFLMVTTIISTLAPLTLSAVTSDDLADVIQQSRIACRAPQVVEPQQRGWFASVRKAVGNGMRWAGNQVRTEEARTPAGKLKEAAKELAASTASAKTRLPIKAAIFNPIGNALRWVGQRVKGGEETQTTTRAIINSLGLNKSSDTDDIADALRVSAQAILKVDVNDSAPEEYLKVVKTLNNRGYSTKSIDALGIYVEALVLEKVANTSTRNFAEFADSFKKNEFEAIKNVLPVKMASTDAKRQAMTDYLKAAYDKARAQVSIM